MIKFYLFIYFLQLLIMKIFVNNDAATTICKLDFVQNY
jgi:hypothetical protein